MRVENGEVTLTGTVDDRNTKRLAEDAAESCSGVTDMHNQLRVKREARDEHRTQTQSDREVPRRTEHEGQGGEGARRNRTGATTAGATT